MKFTFAFTLNIELHSSLPVLIGVVDATLIAMKENNWSILISIKKQAVAEAKMK